MNADNYSTMYYLMDLTQYYDLCHAYLNEPQLLLKYTYKLQVYLMVGGKKANGKSPKK